MKIDKTNPNWGHDFTDDKGKLHVWVPAYKKYVDDLTDQEWDAMENSFCPGNPICGDKN